MEIFSGFWLIILAVVGIAISSLVVWIVYETYMKKIRKAIYNIKQKRHKKQKALRISKMLFNATKYIGANYTQELVFLSFVDFYENVYTDAKEAWSLDAEMFPNGLEDLTSMYRWIKKTRIDNYQELNNLEWDKDRNCFIYWKGTYRNMKCKIDTEGRLHILPLTDVEMDGLEMRFMKLRMGIENALYNLDTHKLTWILERRKFFLI